VLSLESESQSCLVGGDEPWACAGRDAPRHAGIWPLSTTMSCCLKAGGTISRPENSCVRAANGSHARPAPLRSYWESRDIELRAACACSQ